MISRAILSIGSEKSGAHVEAVCRQKQRYEQADAAKHGDGFEYFDVNLGSGRARQDSCDSGHLQRLQILPQNKQPQSLIPSPAICACEPGHRRAKIFTVPKWPPLPGLCGGQVWEEERRDGQAWPARPGRNLICIFRAGGGLCRQCAGLRRCLQGLLHRPPPWCEPADGGAGDLGRTHKLVNFNRLERQTSLTGKPFAFLGTRSRILRSALSFRWHPPTF